MATQHFPNLDPLAFGVTRDALHAYKLPGILNTISAVRQSFRSGIREKNQSHPIVATSIKDQDVGT